jgi:hypothetical protein
MPRMHKMAAKTVIHLVIIFWKGESHVATPGEPCSQIETDP